MFVLFTTTGRLSTGRWFVSTRLRLLQISFCSTKQKRNRKRWTVLVERIARVVEVSIADIGIEWTDNTASTAVHVCVCVYVCVLKWINDDVGARYVSPSRAQTVRESMGFKRAGVA